MGRQVVDFFKNRENWPFYESFFYLIKKSNQNIYFGLEEMQQIERSFNSIGKTSLSQCSFCFHPSQEVKGILRATLCRIGKMLQQKRYCEMEQVQRLSLDSTSNIHRLIRVLFEKQQFQIKFSKNCSHGRLLSLLRQKLKCRCQQLEVVMEELCDKLARRNYELEIIAIQIKNVESSVAQLDQLKMMSNDSRKTSLSSQSSQHKGSSQEVRVKIEENEHKQTFQVSPLTATPNFHLTFENMPYSYNILFLGNPYFQAS